MQCYKNNKEDLNYAKYLQISQLLDLQQLRSNSAHDEMLFIIVHQVYELWFKQILHETIRLKYELENNNIAALLICLKRIRHIFKLLTAQSDILETMSPTSFKSFREYLGKSSGFQSFQFRFLTFLLGIKDKKYLEIPIYNEEEKKKLIEIFDTSSVWDDFINFLKRNLKNENVPVDQFSVHDLFIYIYKNPSLYTEFCELFNRPAA